MSQTINALNFCKAHSTKVLMFLSDTTGSVNGTWKGTLTKAEQMALFGRYFGKGRIVINGEENEVSHWVSVCFGSDWDRKGFAKISEL